MPERAALFQHNYPEAKVFNEDIWKCKDDIVSYYQNHFGAEELVPDPRDAPCQGMSSNGMGKMLNDYRKGLRPKFDERNRLILPTLDIIAALNPQWVIFENVPNMQNTLIYDEPVFTTVERRLGGSFPAILCQFPLKSVRIPAENFLVWRQNPSPIRHPPVVNTGSYILSLALTEDGKLVNIIDYIVARLGDDYVGKAEVVGAADYGVPQNRKRLLTIFS